MSKRRLVITAVLAGQSQSEVARTYGVSQGWISRLMARYRIEGDAAFEPLSRAPKTSPAATAPETVELVLALRKQLSESGHDAGPDTICWHLTQHHGISLSRASVHRILTRHGAITPEPRKRPKSSYIRFEAEQPNETWQSDFTHYRLTNPTAAPGQTSRSSPGSTTTPATHCTSPPTTASPRRSCSTTFTETAAQHGYPASTLTDNGMVYTVRFAGGKGGRSKLEHELRRLNIVQKNSRPNHPTTCGKVERFQQTMKKWLRAQPDQPATLTQLQVMLDRFRDDYNQRRPHRSLEHRATPAAAYRARPKAAPGADRAHETHHRVRTDKIDKSGVVTLRHNGRLHHIGVGRTHAGTYVRLLVQDLDITLINATTGEIIRELTLDPTRDYQPTGRPPGPTKQ